MALNEPECPSDGKSKLIHTVNESLPSIGLPFDDTATSEPWIGQPSSPLTSSVEGSPVKTSASQGKGPDSVAHEAASGPNMSKRLPRSNRSTSSSKTSQPFALEDWIKCSGKSLRSATMRNGIVYPLPPLVPLTGGIASGLWPTPGAQEGGPIPPDTIYRPNQRSYNTRTGKHVQITIRRFVEMWPTPSAGKTTLSGELVNADGTPWNGISKPHSATTGRPVSTHLTDAVKMWPTPNARDHKDTGENCNWEKISKKSKLAGRVMWPTPSSNNGTGGATGLAGGSGNRKKLYKLLGETEGKKMGCQSLNPYWVEWLMGYPLGWTDLGGSATPLSRKSRKS